MCAPNVKLTERLLGCRNNRLAFQFVITSGSPSLEIQSIEVGSGSFSRLLKKPIMH